MNATPPSNRYPTLHRDGTVSYWSMHRSEWVPRAFHVPIEDLELMAKYDQRRILRHLGLEAESGQPHVAEAG